jgi:N-dimethylarginine dimethylaminohydrolase
MKTKLLMCRPKYFDVNYVINPWMKGNIHKVSHELAVEQWENFYNTIKKYATVELIDPIKDLPDMVFTANGALCDIKNNVALFGEFANKERKQEKPYFMEWFKRNGWNVIDIPDLFEGAGECLKDAQNQYWYGYGFRGTKQTTDILQQHLPNLHQLKLINPKFYHLDTCFCPLSGGDVLYYPEAFDEKSNLLISSVLQHKAIAVSQQDAMVFACNAVCVENTIFVNNMSEQLETYLYYKNYEVIRVPLTEFLKSGGGAKCLTLQLQ